MTIHSRGAMMKPSGHGGRAVAVRCGAALPRHSLGLVLVNPGGPRIIAKGWQDDALYLSNGGNVFRSTDGQNWTQLTSKWLVLDPIDMAVDPTNSQTLYLPRQTWGILKSTNTGSNWSSINEGLRNTVAAFVTTSPFPGNDTIYTNGHVSRDGGDTWQFYLDRGIDHPFFDEVAPSPFDPEEVWFVADVGSAYVSADAGNSWTKTMDQSAGGRGFRSGSVYSAATSPSDPDRIYANRNGMGIFRSDNGGASQRFLYPSLVDYTYSLAVHPADPDILFSGYTPKPFQDWAMVQKTTDGGLTWSTALSVPHSSRITSVVFDPQNPNRLYAGSTGSGAAGGGQIYTSANGGSTWGKLNEHFTMLTVWGQPQLIADPDQPNVAHAGTWLGGTWKTTDAGSSWTLLEKAPISSTALSRSPGNPNVIYSADRTRPWVWQSTDGGATWTKIGAFEGAGAFLVNRVLAAGEVVYASTFGPGMHDGRLYRRPAAGGPWTDITGALPRSVLDIAVSPIHPQVIYVTTHVHGAYKSVNGGATWDKLVNFPDIGGYDIELDPFDPGIVYAAGMGATPCRTGSFQAATLSPIPQGCTGRSMAGSTGPSS